MFTWQASYGIQNCTDGTSNTIAYAEACVGNQTEQPLQKLIGLQGVQIPYTSMLLDGSSAPGADPRRDPVVQSGLPVREHLLHRPPAR